MNKKCKNILNKYMDDMTRGSLSFEEIEYAKACGAIVEDLPISNAEAIMLLSQGLDSISLVDASDAFLYSLSTRDMEYRYILSSYIYAKAWIDFDKGDTEKAPLHLQRTFYNWLKYHGGGVWAGIGKPLYYLSEFIHIDKPKPSGIDYDILKEILHIACTMDNKSTGVDLCNEIAKRKILIGNKVEIRGVVETLGICGVLEVPEHRGYLDSFAPPLLRDTGDLRQSLSYPLNWWKGIHKVNFENVHRVFHI